MGGGGEEGDGKQGGGQREGRREKKVGGKEKRANTFVDVSLAEWGDSKSLHLQDAYNFQKTSTKINEQKCETL